MRFIQHLLEAAPSNKEKLLEVNSEDFLNVLLAAAGEDSLQEGELAEIPEYMTVGELINMYEGRMPPPRMNYDFDEVDPDVNKNSFRDAGRHRRSEERSGSALNSADGRDPRYNPSRAELAADREWEAEQRWERQAMHGTEEEESLADIRQRAKEDMTRRFAGVRKRNAENVAKARGRKSGQRDPRGDAAEERMQHQMMHGTEEEEVRGPAKRDMVRATGRAIHQSLNTKSDKRLKQHHNRFARTYTGRNHPAYDENA